MAERHFRESPAVAPGAPPAIPKSDSPPPGGKARASLPVWIAALFPILLAAALVVPVLDRDIFDVDEAATLIAAGARHLGPLTLADAAEVTTSRWPGQALGHVLAWSVWGRLVGWSEFAVRALPWLAGALALAWVWRCGQDLFSARVAFCATLLLSTSVLLLTYMHIARAYGAAILFAAMTLQGYWSVALSDRVPGNRERMTLVLGATGLLYSHYFCALLLPALGLFHLLFLRKDRRWWQPAILLGLAALLALPQMPDLLSGIGANQGRTDLHASALHAPEAMALFLRYLGNGLVNTHQPLNALAVFILPLILGAAVWRRRRLRKPPGPFVFLTVAALAQLLLLLGANEWLQVLNSRRIRYLASLWPHAALLVSALALLPKRCAWRAVTLGLLALVALNGAHEFRREGELVLRASAWKKFSLSVAMANRMAGGGAANNLLLVDPAVFGSRNRSYELYTGAWRDRLVDLDQSSSAAILAEQVRQHDELWILTEGHRLHEPPLPALFELLQRDDWRLLRTWKEAHVVLLQLTSTGPVAGLDQAALDFGQGVVMTGMRSGVHDRRHTFEAGLQSADHALLAHYSLALHVIDPRTGERAAQGDVGVGPGRFVALRSDIDLSALPPGDYELHLALYDWQTGERLSARDLQTGELGDMHVLHRFRLD